MQTDARKQVDGGPRKFLKRINTLPATSGVALRSCLLLTVLVLAGCSRADAPTGPAAPPPPPPPPATISAVASRYLTDVLDIIQANSLGRLSTDWPVFRASVFSAAGSAQTINDLDFAMRTALGLLGDGHSFYRSAAGHNIYVPNRSCGQNPIQPVTVPARIGYVRVPGFSGGGAPATQFAAALQQSIRAQDNSSLIGWIVDLRGNVGGNMWPMLAGVGPVLGADTVGRFVGPDPTLFWEYRGGAAILSGFVVAQVENPYTVVNERPRVAVLTDNSIQSSGEAIVIAFRKRPNTRSFGVATCGLSTANRAFSLSDGAVLTLTVAVMADREGGVYGEQVEPDELLSNGAVDRAIAWLELPS